MSNAASKLIHPETGDEIDVPAEGLSETGELWFKGPNVMAGYLGNEQATAETIDDDGWLHTGDLAQVDACGCVYIVDRLKELIKYKGYQVPPAELEAVLLSHPAIADAAVIGVNDAEGEEVPKAFVVKQSGAELTEDEVMEFVAGQVAPYKKVRQVAVHRRDPEVGVGQDPAQGSTGDDLVPQPPAPRAPAGSRGPRRRRVSAAARRRPTVVRSVRPRARRSAAG